MPITRYRLLPDYPEKLRFRNGTVLLTFRVESDHFWVSYAQLESDPSRRVEIMRGPTMLRWAADRFGGFDVESGSPADKVMKALVKMGGATEMKPGETFFSRRPRPGRYH